jgi:hypothetical protein
MELVCVFRTAVALFMQKTKEVKWVMLFYSVMEPVVFATPHKYLKTHVQVDFLRIWPYPFFQNDKVARPGL